jgi:hypothetical protein
MCPSLGLRGVLGMILEVLLLDIIAWPDIYSD